ncbi:hypothetical protein NLX83_31655 [Allokutzneria sp. A3M-2-11 16]|uniref:hypothetical protein n=1 Tax=Allokutzneria sp. A3M-2-11 16 TaxID=2962043 RepID=UPI0020B8B57C|nr:hypothetical protein [Allokutzneria sp. A3M-2-11 16]MCP3803835.1 hypothetical protein [Allokutzneria sp. A3M-2-11 16]
MNDDRSRLPSDNRGRPRITFIYPSRPRIVATTLESSVARLRRLSPDREWFLWKEMPTQGVEIFPHIAEEIAGSATVVAEVTSFNTNVLFEIGYALGRGVAVVPIRDGTFDVNGASCLKMVGWLNSLGCVEFRNSDELVAKLRDSVPVARPLPPVREAAPGRRPELILLDSPHAVEGRVQLGRALRRADVTAESLDHVSSLRSLLTKVADSCGVAVHMIDERRAGAHEHNARCVFLAGVATGAGLPTLLLQEGRRWHPVDYSDLVLEYDNPFLVPELISPFLRAVADLRREPVVDEATESRAEDLKDFFLVDEDPAEGALQTQLAAHLGVSTADLPRMWTAFSDSSVAGEPIFTFLRNRCLPGRSTASSIIRETAMRAVADGRERMLETDFLAAERSVSRAVLREFSTSWSTESSSADVQAFVNSLNGSDSMVSPRAVVERAASLGAPEAATVALLVRAAADGALFVWDWRSASSVEEARQVDVESRSPGDWLLDPGWVVSVHPALWSALAVRREKAGIAAPIWSIG